MNNYLVEAAGIEPASESTTLRHLHVYPDYYVSDFKMPSGRLFEIQSPFVLLKSQEKKGEISEDELKRYQEQVQKLTDKYIKEIDQLAEAKEQEIMQV